MDKAIQERYEILRKAYGEHSEYVVGFRDCVQIVEANSADSVEVEHGEWIEDAYYDNPCVCSVCGCEAPYTSKFNETFDYDWEENLQHTGYEETKDYIRTPYCQNCGAKMDGERSEK